MKYLISICFSKSTEQLFCPIRKICNSPKTKTTKANEEKKQMDEIQKQIRMHMQLQKQMQVQMQISDDCNKPCALHIVQPVLRRQGGYKVGK